MSSSVLRLKAFSMSSYNTYSFKVVVLTPDGRSDSKVVAVTPIDDSDVRLSINSTIVRFNPDSKLILYGYLTSKSALTSTWSSSTPLGVSVPFTALTSLKKDFSSADTKSKVLYPLSIEGGILSGSRSFIFKLSAYPIGFPSAVTYSQISLIMNIPPSGGYVESYPTIGNALITPFTITSPGWTSDAANLPLTYSFFYKVAKQSSDLTLSSPSLRAFTVTTLPAGLSVLNNTLTIKSTARDIFSSSASFYATVAVIDTTMGVGKTASSASSLRRITIRDINDAILVGDTDAILRTINIVSTQKYYTERIESKRYRSEGKGRVDRRGGEENSRADKRSMEGN